MADRLKRVKHGTSNMTRVKQTCIRVQSNEGSEEGDVAVRVDGNMQESTTGPPSLYTPRKVKQKEDTEGKQDVHHHLHAGTCAALEL
jgi:hypothetical protein